MNINFSLVLPCYNEEQNIDSLFKEIQKLDLNNIFCEFIFVNNGSEDKTELKIDNIIKVSNQNSNKQYSIVKLNLDKNLGYGGGILAGLKYAKGQYIGWCHADLQTPLEDFLKLYVLVNGKSKVFGKGYRINNRGFDSLISKIHEKFASIILGADMKEVNAQPKIINKNDFLIFTNPPKKWTTIDTYFYFMALKNNFTIKTINVTFKPRIYGHSKWKNNKYTFLKYLILNFLYFFKLKLSYEKNNSTKSNS